MPAENDDLVGGDDLTADETDPDGPAALQADLLDLAASAHRQIPACAGRLQVGERRAHPATVQHVDRQRRDPDRTRCIVIGHQRQAGGGQRIGRGRGDCRLLGTQVTPDRHRTTRTVVGGTAEVQVPLQRDETGQHIGERPTGNTPPVVIGRRTARANPALVAEQPPITRPRGNSIRRPDTVPCNAQSWLAMDGPCRPSSSYGGMSAAG